MELKVMDLKELGWNESPTGIYPPAKEILTDLTPEQIRELARKDEKTTNSGSAAYVTKIRNRSAKFTDIVLEEMTPEQKKTVTELLNYVKGLNLIQVDRQMCLNSDFNLHCRSFVSQDYARIAYMWGQTLFPYPTPADSPYKNPDITVLMVPEWPERKVIVDAVNRITYIMGTDYMGELKKANLRLGMYLAKKTGYLGLHAASKKLRVKDVEGRLQERGMLLFGLSGTGKTSLTCHPHGLSGEEGIVIRQDDVVFLRSDGYGLGTENNFYLKTEGLDEKSQPILYKAAMAPRAILENVWVDESGKIDFFNDTHTSNGRGIVFRADMNYTDDKIDLENVDIVIFIVRRNDIVPPVAKLSPAQGAMFFMLGESVETSAGDPTQAGKALRVVGTNPFIIGPESEEGNIFYDIIKKNPQISCYLINTGYVGGKETGEKITIIDTAEIIKQIARGSITWKTDPDWGYQVPENVEGIDYARFNLDRFYTPEQRRELTQKLKEERRTYLAKYADVLYSRIMDSIILD